MIRHSPPNRERQQPNSPKSNRLSVNVKNRAFSLVRRVVNLDFSAQVIDETVLDVRHVLDFFRILCRNGDRNQRLMSAAQAAHGLQASVCQASCAAPKFDFITQ